MKQLIPKPFCFLPRFLTVWAFPFLLFNAVSSSWAELDSPSRISYWSHSGENLIPVAQEIPFLERQQLFKLLKEKNKILFIDIREPDEYQKSHLPNALNISFINRNTLYDQLKTDSNQILIPYCNWDFRGYVAAVELKRNGFSNVAMMYPHGLRGWIASGLPVAGETAGKTDQEAAAELINSIKTFDRHPEAQSAEGSKTEILRFAQDDIQGKTLRISLRILPKRVEPQHIEASVGDRLILDLVAEEEDHWFVIPDFDVNVHLEKGEKRTVEIRLARAGYFPFGCITCCTRYRCQTKQAILVDLNKESLSSYGE